MSERGHSGGAAEGGLLQWVVRTQFGHRARRAHLLLGRQRLARLVRAIEHDVDGCPRSRPRPRRPLWPAWKKGERGAAAGDGSQCVSRQHLSGKGPARIPGEAAHGTPK